MVLEQRRVPVEFFVLTGLIFSAAILVSSNLSGSAQDGLVALGVTLDLTLLVPGLYYWLGIRRAGWPKISILPVFLFCVFAASQILPSELHGHLSKLYWVVPAVEVALVLGVLLALRKALQARASVDGLETTEEIVLRLTGSARVASALGYEIGLFSYAVTRQKPAALKPGEFSYHQRTAVRAYTGALLLVTAAEVLPMHLLLSYWSSTAAWVVLALTIYSVFWFIGDVRAMSRRPIRVDEHRLRLRFGLRWSLDIPWSAIESLEAGTESKVDSKETLSLIPMGSGANCRLTFDQPVESTGPYGIKKQVREVMLFVDERSDFEAACRVHLEA